jgi:hypothetical protein
MHMGDIGPPGARETARVSHVIDDVKFRADGSDRAVPRSPRDPRDSEGESVTALGKSLRKCNQQRDEAPGRRIPVVGGVEDSHVRKPRFWRRSISSSAYPRRRDGVGPVVERG